MEFLRLFSMVAAAGGLGLLGLGLARVVLVHDVNPLAEIVDDGEIIDFDKEPTVAFRDRFAGARGKLGGVGRRFTPGSMLNHIRRHAVLAGIGASGVESILAIKAVASVTGAVLLPLAGVALTDAGSPFLFAGGGAILGFFIPDLWISKKGAKRQLEIRRDLPETIDLMAIAVQAGMGLEASIELASQALPGALGDELYRLLQEIQLGSSRRQALEQLRDRTNISELSSFALALIQADATGSPIADVLQANAARMRMVRRQTAREKAAKLPVKLLFPVLVFIFPALFVVVIGPAGISIVETLGKP